VKFVHVSDLHIGKTVREADLLPDQRAVLDEIAALCASEKPAALLIAGDVYDRAVPNPEAVEAFGAFLAKVRSIPEPPAIVAISGNHDSARRLGFGDRLLEVAGVHLRTRAAEVDAPIELRSGDEVARIWAIPFLQAAEAGVPRTQDGASEAMPSQALAFARAIDAIEKARENLGPGIDVLVAHAFAVGGATSGSERSFVGGAETVPTDAFSRFDYVALGHLHGYQRSGERGRYSGAPMRYSFGEERSKVGAVVVELGIGRFEERFVPIQAPRDFARIRGTLATLLHGQGNGRDYVEVELEDDVPVLNAAERLREKFPYLLGVRQKAFAAGTAVRPTSASEPSRDPLEAVRTDFADFYRQTIGSEPDEGASTLFESLLAKAAASIGIEEGGR
jgi:exonuclease SbcD